MRTGMNSGSCRVYTEMTKSVKTDLKRQPHGKAIASPGPIVPYRRLSVRVDASPQHQARAAGRDRPGAVHRVRAHSAPQSNVPLWAPDLDPGANPADITGRCRRAREVAVQRQRDAGPRRIHG